jgi:hypothetical protein
MLLLPRKYLDRMQGETKGIKGSDIEKACIE